MTIQPDDMVPAPIVKKPLTPVQKAKDKSYKLIKILKDDFKYDIVKEIIETMALIKRAKKIKPLEKYRLLKDYQLTLLSYCMPKMKVIEDNSANVDGKGVVFNIQIGGTSDDPKPVKGKVSKSKKGVSVAIPTTKQPDGTYTISDD